MATLVRGERKWVTNHILRKHYTRLNEVGEHERPSGKLKEGMIVYRDDVVYELFLHDFVNNRWYLEVSD
jgi:hypothetical protein